MAIEPLGVLTIPPNWSEGSVETLAWYTSVTESPQAVEQRMGLRLSPRQMFENSYTVFNRRRTHFDMFNMAAGGSPFYLPIWHDKATLTSDAAIGATTLNLDTQYTEFQNCRVAVLIRNDFEYELVEIDSFTNSSLTLVAGLDEEWLQGSAIYPCKKVRVETQANGDRHADKAFTARMRFISLEKNISNAEITLDEYLGNPVLVDSPNDGAGVQYQYNRKEYLLDNRFGLIQLSDVAPYIQQNHSWFAKGRQRAWRLRGLLYLLQGMRRPIWVPSFFADFELSEPAAAIETTIIVKRCGYTDTGGPFLHRDHILIHMRNGTRLYRKITGSAIVGAEGLYETIGLEEAHGVELTPDNVFRISFITFCRLDQDTIELVHHSDSKGLTTAGLVWRTDPGIGATYSETTTEVEPPDPEVPAPLVIVDPFKIPAEKIWLYGPSFGTGIGAPYIANFWDYQRSDVDTGFPSGSFTVVAQNVSLPTTGSFLVRARTFFTKFFVTTYQIDACFMRIVFENSTLDPVEVSSAFDITDTNFALQCQSDRESVYFSTVDHELPQKVRMEIRCDGTTGLGGGNIFPAANFDRGGVADPFQTGDAYFIVEWWP